MDRNRSLLNSQSARGKVDKIIYYCNSRRRLRKKNRKTLVGLPIYEMLLMIDAAGLIICF